MDGFWHFSSTTPSFLSYFFYPHPRATFVTLRIFADSSVGIISLLDSLDTNLECQVQWELKFYLNTNKRIRNNRRVVRENAKGGLKEMFVNIKNFFIAPIESKNLFV